MILTWRTSARGIYFKKSSAIGTVGPSLIEATISGTKRYMNYLAILLIFLGFSAHAYQENEIHFQTHGKVKLMGYMSRPSKPGKYPALILQMGHGQGTTDNKSRSYNPFAEMARQIADAGFIVLRFDKRGTGYNASNGSYENASFTDFIQDLRSAIKHVQKSKDVNSHEVYLFGHSLGGPIISIVANDTPDVKGIILSASPGRSFAEFNLEQMKYLFELGQSLKGKELESEIEKVRRSDELIAQPKIFCKEFPTDCAIKKGRTYLWGQSTKFWKEISELNPLAPLQSLTCKVFALHGSSDWVVSSDNDGGSIAKAMAGKSNFTSKILPGLDHFLLNAESKKASIEKFNSGLKDGAEIHPQFISEITSTLKNWTAN